MPGPLGAALLTLPGSSMPGALPLDPCWRSLIMPRRVEDRSPRSGSDTRKLTKSIGVRFTAEAMAEVIRQAELAGLGRGDYIRRRALGHPILAKTDTVLINELRRLGGLTKHLYNQGQLSSYRGNQLLFELVAAIRRVGIEGD